MTLGWIRWFAEGDEEMHQFFLGVDFSLCIISWWMELHIAWGMC